MRNKPFIKLFKSASGFYVYDINTNQILKTSDVLYNSLSSILKYGLQITDSFSDEIKQQLINLSNEGYLKENPIQRIVSPYHRFYKSFLYGKMSSLVLEVTQQCNFRCEYCDYSSHEFFNRNHNIKDMSIDMAKRAIDIYFENSIYENIKSFAFYGGEPLLVYQLIKQCVQYIQTKVDNNETIYRITTNGSLLTEEMVQFFSENNFLITISLDGPPYYHNKNRKFSCNSIGTFQLVYQKLKMIHELQYKYPLSININAVWDGSLPKKVIEDYFMNDPIIGNYPFEINEMSSSDLNTYFAIEEDDILIDGNNKLKRILTNKFLKKNNTARNEENKHLLDMLKVHTSLSEEYHPSGMCIAGQKNLYVTADGDFFPCEKFSTNCKYAQIGTITEGFDCTQINKLLNLGQITEEECKKCWAVRLCSICALGANGGEVLSREAKLSYCTLQKQNILQDLKNLVTLIAIDKTLLK